MKTFKELTQGDTLYIYDKTKQKVFMSTITNIQNCKNSLIGIQHQYDGYNEKVLVKSTNTEEHIDDGSYGITIFANKEQIIPIVQQMIVETDKQEVLIKHQKGELTKLYHILSMYESDV